MRYSIKSSVKASDVGASVTFEIKPVENKLLKWHCCACAFPLKRNGIRITVACPRCGAVNILD